MKKIEVLCWGVEHIAQNHNFSATVNYEEDGEVCIFGGSSVPALADVRLLCEDLGIGKNAILPSEFGIDICIPDRWDGESEYQETGLELWKRAGSVIGQ